MPVAGAARGDMKYEQLSAKYKNAKNPISFSWYYYGCSFF